MSGNDLTIEKVVATVRERGAMRNMDICAALGVVVGSVALGRLLQKARKAGLLRCSGGRWVAAEVETADEKIARLERELASALELATDMQRGLDSYMADHARIESERAQTARERDALKAQLAALTTERESAARAAEERIGRLTEALRAVVAADEQIDRGGMSEAVVEAMIGALNSARAVLAEVKP